VVSLLGGGTLLYSLRGNWRSRLYLFFFSVAILPLGFSWGIRENSVMPESEFRMFIEVLDIIPEKSLFYADEDNIPALQWCTGEKINAIECGCEIVSTAPDKPTYIIVEKNSAFLKKISVPEKRILEGKNFTCMEILPAKSK
jgi:hypothetical protein